MGTNNGWVRTAAVAAMCLGLAAGASAQDDKKANREREALRRTQQALRSSQEQQAALQKERATLTAEKQALGDAADRATRQAGAAQAQLRSARDGQARLSAEVEQLRAERDALKTAVEQAQASAAQRARELAEARQLLDERTRTVARTAALLEHGTKALGEAERKNQQLYAIGLKLLADYRDAGGGNPLTGFEGVARENEAEAIRTRIEAERVGVAPAR